jgi:hypothetical protein
MPREFLHNHRQFADLIRTVAAERNIVPALVSSSNAASRPPWTAPDAFWVGSVRGSFAEIPAMECFRTKNGLVAD